MMFKNSYLRLFTAMIVLSLAACGGGGSTSSPKDVSGSYNITISASLLSSGAVSGGGSYNANQTVSLTASPNAGYSFINWTESGTEVSTSSSYTFTATSNRTLVANFVVSNYSVNATTSPVNEGTVTGGGNYNHGSTVTLAASPNTGYSFINWTESGTEVSTSSSYSFAVTSNRTLIANFVSHISVLNGRYDGVMKSPLAVFGADQTYTTFDVSGTDITITQEHFFGETCIFTGQVTDIAFPSTALGSYQCSDFSNGTWSSSAIAKTSADAFVAELEIDPGSGVYIAKYNGFLEEVDVLSKYFVVPGYYYDSGNYLDIAGTYIGDLKSSDSCAAHTFEMSSSETTISISGSDIEITQDAFFEGTCIFSGTISDTGIIPLSASGSYQCSNFDNGTWSSGSIALTGTDSFLAVLSVDVPARGCEYVVKYSGFK